MVKGHIFGLLASHCHIRVPGILGAYNLVTVNDLLVGIEESEVVPLSFHFFGERIGAHTHTYTHTRRNEEEEQQENPKEKKNMGSEMGPLLKITCLPHMTHE